MQAMDFRKIPAEKLNPAHYNPRKDLKPGDPEYEKLLRSVEEFGYIEPVVWNERTGHIVGGHQRFKVLVQLGLTEIDCVVVNMEETREKACNIALNKISGEWDTQKLYVAITDLEKYGFDVAVTGFEVQELDKMWQTLERKKGNIVEDNFNADEEAAKIENAVTQPGDIWQIGRHRLMCGDSTDVSAVKTLMEGKKAKFSFTDPPWNVDYGGTAHPSWKQRSIMNDKMSKEDFRKFLLAAFSAMASVVEPGAVVYIAMSAQEWGTLMPVMEEAGYHWSSTIIWFKDSLVMSRKDYHTQYEPIWYGWKTGAAHLVSLEDRKQSDVWEIPRPKKSEEHPTMKPIELVARAINNSSWKGDDILDLFGGSGTTMMAAEQTDRTAHLMELDPKYCDVIALRFAKMQNTDSGIFLLRDGQKLSFNEVMGEQKSQS